MRKRTEVRRCRRNSGQDPRAETAPGNRENPKLTPEEALQFAPESTGAYRFWDNEYRVLYVGKAKNIRKRLRSHYSRHSTTPRHDLILERAAYIDWIIVQSETEALILEDALIKRHRPPFNVIFRDDKRYPMLRLDITDPFPTLTVVRRTASDGALYFGPYTSSRTMKSILTVISRCFPLRRCSAHRFSQGKICLNFQMQRCSGPCAGNISREDYRKIVKQVRMLLSSKNEALIQQLTRNMLDCAEKEEFEAAARLRDQIHAVKRLSGNRQLLISRPVNMEVFAFMKSNQRAYCEILFIKSGIIHGSIHRSMDIHPAIPLEDIVTKFLVHHSQDGMPISTEIILSHLPDRFPSVHTILEKRAGHRVNMHVPRKGIKAKLLRIAYRNLRNRFEIDIKRSPETAPMELLAKYLDIDRRLTRIEAMDISETQGKEAVGSLVCFFEGKPEKKRYRRFRIREGGTSDVARIGEVMRRRLARSNRPGWELPDLILIDGGKHQLNAARNALADQKDPDVLLIALAKDRRNRGHETIIMPNGREILIAEDNPIKYFIDLIRDEAHRFAITYHRSRRAARSLHTSFMDIPGIGKKRRLILVRRFGSVKNLKKATLRDLETIPGIGKKTAQVIHHFFEPPSPSEK